MGKGMSPPYNLITHDLLPFATLGAMLYALCVDS
jgi:hypothetical protein